VSEIDEKNHNRWQRFREDPNYSRVVVQVLALLDAAGLDQSTMGIDWGLTVHVDKDTFLRVNHADYALFDIRNPELPLDDRRVVIAVLNMDSKKPRFLARAAGKLAKSEFQRGNGFTKLVQGSEVVSTWFYDLQTVLLRENVQAGIRNHVQARPRKLYSTGRHNPLATEIFS